MPVTADRPAPGAVLDGRRCIVTGAARGIGREIAISMAHAGAPVAVTSRRIDDAQRTVQAIERDGGRAIAVALDLQDRESVDAAFTRIARSFGAPQVLVCNSGIGGPSKPVWELTDDDWDDVLDVNAGGAFRCVRAVLPHMIRAKAGVVLFIGSMTGKRPLLHRSPYAASKMALLGLCRTLALDVGVHGVRANVVSPGLVDGQRMEWVVEQQALARGIDAQQVRDGMLVDTPLRRFTTASDVASTVVFLASDAAAGITGEDVNVSSGMVMY